MRKFSQATASEGEAFRTVKSENSGAGKASGFFAYPLRGLNEIIDPSKATSARPRKLGLPDFVGTSRPQTCAFALRDASLGQDGCPRNFVGPLRGRAGFVVKIRKELNQNFLHGSHAKI